MVKVNRRPNKHGAITVFLSLVLSSIILVECTYIIIVANLERGLALHRAAELQVNSYLAQYDRHLLRTYGIYGVNLNGLDDAIFQEVMFANGIEDGDYIVVSGYETFDTDDLRRAIATFYTYRVTGLTYQTYAYYMRGLLSNPEFNDLFDAFREFLNSGAGTILKNIISGAVSVTDTLESVADTFDLEELSQSINRFNRLISMMDDALSMPLNPDNGFDPNDLGFGLTAVETVENMINATSSVIEENLLHPFTANYASFNFDCFLDDDKALDGTLFSNIHNGNRYDVEYILTGNRGSEGKNSALSYVYMTLIIKNIVQVYTNSSLHLRIQEVANVLSIVVDVISAGAIILPGTVYEAVIVILYGVANAGTDLALIMDGRKVSLTNIDGLSEISWGYRDFIFLYMLLVPDDELLERMTEIINRDYSHYAVSLEVTAGCNSCDSYTVSRGYTFYE